MQPDYRFDLLGAFLAGVGSMVALCYLLWRSAGKPPPR